MTYIILSQMLVLLFRFSDKTRNDWANRKKFVKVAGKYDLLEMDYSAKVHLRIKIISALLNV